MVVFCQCIYEIVAYVICMSSRDLKHYQQHHLKLSIQNGCVLSRHGEVVDGLHEDILVSPG